jgi:FKBP-type peptidyl-prolyl cis-trans isomerase
MTVRTFALAALAAACLPAAAIAQDAPTAAGQDAAWMNAQQAALASRQAKDGWSWLPGGLLWRRIAGDGAGAHPTADDAVRVHYEGTFVDGRKFDSSYDRGDTIELAAPASLAYGPIGRGPIPGGATLLFKIELLAIEGR